MKNVCTNVKYKVNKTKMPITNGIFFFDTFHGESFIKCDPIKTEPENGVDCVDNTQPHNRKIAINSGVTPIDSGTKEVPNTETMMTG